jgi:hypothetical protein
MHAAYPFSYLYVNSRLVALYVSQSNTELID